MSGGPEQSTIGLCSFWCLRAAISITLIRKKVRHDAFDTLQLQMLQNQLTTDCCLVAFLTVMSMADLKVLRSMARLTHAHVGPRSMSAYLGSSTVLLS